MTTPSLARAAEDFKAEERRELIEGSCDPHFNPDLARDRNPQSGELRYLIDADVKGWYEQNKHLFYRAAACFRKSF